MSESLETIVGRLDERVKAQGEEIGSLKRIVYGLLITSATTLGNLVLSRIDFGKDEAVAVPPAALSLIFNFAERIMAIVGG